MRNIKKALLSPMATIVAFVLAAGLLLFSSIGGARAALTYFSQTYASRVRMYDIGVTLQENGERVSWRDYDYELADGSWDQLVPGPLLAHMLDDGPLQYGRAYREELNVRNSGTINEYVRVTVYKYWEDANGNKRTDLDPSLIDLHLVNVGDIWQEDVAARTQERTVLYYTRLLRAATYDDDGNQLTVAEQTPLFADTLTINGDVVRTVSRTTLEDGSLRVEYMYDGARFVVVAHVDAVQENNAEAAALSAWGREVRVDEQAGTLRLN